MSYTPYQPMIADARVHNAFWRLFLGLVTVFAVCILWMFAVFTLGLWLTGGSLGLVAGDALAPVAQTPLATLVFLLLIVGLGVGAWVAARFWQNRGLRSLAGRGPVVLRHFVVATLVTWALAAVLSLAAWPFTAPIVQNLDFGTWLLWLPVALVAVALQTGSEELLFRGYVQSQVAARFHHPVVWLVAPALLFGAAHFLPTLPLNAGLVYVAFAALFGVLAGDLTARTGSIGAAWGFHFANNSLAILVVVTEGSLTGLGLYRSGDVVDALSLSPLMIVDLVAMVVVWLSIRRLLTA